MVQRGYGSGNTRGLAPKIIIARSVSEGSGCPRLRFGLVCRQCYSLLNHACALLKVVFLVTFVSLVVQIRFHAIAVYRNLVRLRFGLVCRQCYSLLNHAWPLLKVVFLVTFVSLVVQIRFRAIAVCRNLVRWRFKLRGAVVQFM